MPDRAGRCGLSHEQDAGDTLSTHEIKHDFSHETRGNLYFRSRALGTRGWHPAVRPAGAFAQKQLWIYYSEHNHHTQRKTDRAESTH